MTQFRIVTDGKVFRVQYKYRFWPVWFVADSPNEGGGTTYLEWGTKEEARGYIDRSLHVRTRTWETV